MTDPTAQHLYVMQNEFGCIKVGRSVDPWQRRHSLRQSEHCQVELIIAVEGGGEDEEAIHYRLRKHHLVGEWFNGTNATRNAVAKEFQPLALDWKFRHDPEGAAEWLDHFQVVRKADANKKWITSEIGIMRGLPEPHYIHDGAVFSISYFYRNGEQAIVSVGRVDGRSTYIWHHPVTGERIAVPEYTSNLALALTAWPDDARPASWEGTAPECCIEALRAIRRMMPKVPRFCPSDDYEGTQ